MKKNKIISSPVPIRPEPVDYPLYPPEEDIYNQSQLEPDINPEEITSLKSPNETALFIIEKPLYHYQDVAIFDLDIPGSDLDDAAELDGNEDEENNYYSLSGDILNDPEDQEVVP